MNPEHPEPVDGSNPQPVHPPTSDPRVPPWHVALWVLLALPFWVGIAYVIQAARS